MSILNELRDKLEDGITTGFNLIRMSQKCDSIFNEYTIFEKTKRMMALSLIFTTRNYLGNAIVEYETEDLYESCRASFTAYIENDNSNEDFGIYEVEVEDEDELEQAFENTYGDFDNILDILNKEVIRLTEATSNNVFISKQTLFLCLLIINACEFNYPNELSFYYESQLTPDSEEIEFNHVEDEHQDHVGI